MQCILEKGDEFENLYPYPIYPTQILIIPLVDTFEHLISLLSPIHFALSRNSIRALLGGVLFH